MDISNYNPTSSAPAAESEIAINNLTDDSLGMIFNRLPFRDRLRIESVCKRWRDVSKANWCLFNWQLMINDFPSLHNDTPENNQNILVKMLEQRGQTLWKINFTGVNGQRFPGGTMKQMIKHCPKLQYLMAGDQRLTPEDRRACSNLGRMMMVVSRGD